MAFLIDPSLRQAQDRQAALGMTVGLLGMTEGWKVWRYRVFLGFKELDSCLRRNDRWGVAL